MAMRRPNLGPPLGGPQVRRANRKTFNTDHMLPGHRPAVRHGAGWLEYEMGGVPPGPNQLRQLPPIRRRRLGHSRWSVEQEWTSTSYYAALEAMGTAGMPAATKGEKREVLVTVYRVKPLDPGHLEDSATPIVNALKHVMRRKKEGSLLLPIPGVGLLYEDDAKCVDLTVVQVPVPHFVDEYTVVRVSLCLP